MKGLRFVEVPDDHLEPSIRRRDFMLLAETDRYIGEGYYLLQFRHKEEVWLNSYHCSAGGSRTDRRVRLTCHNPAYRGIGDRELTLDEFINAVVGKAVMTCKVQDHGLLDHRVLAA